MADPASVAQIDRIFKRFRTNVARAARITEVVNQANHVLGEISDDIRRSSVVFLHAAFEDVLRSIGRLRLPSAGSSALEDITLSGFATASRPARFSLSQLAEHRGKPVDDVIYQSVREYLDKKSFSSEDDVAGFVKSRLELDPSAFAKCYSDLKSLMSRRHRIVHQADHLDDQATSPVSWSLADAESFQRWMRAVVHFGFLLCRLSRVEGERDEWSSRHTEFVQSFGEFA